MNEERIVLLQQYYKLQKERDNAREKGFFHIERARKYRMNLIEKKLKRMKENKMSLEP